MSADPHSLLSFKAIRNLWVDLNISLYPVQLRPEDNPALDAQTLAFLSEVGFPEAAEPELDFTDLSEKLFTHTQLYAREDFPALDQYLVIGATGEGNPVCIDTTDGTVGYIDHDHGFEQVLMNASLILFSYCLAQYGKAVQHGSPAKDRIALLRNDMTAADPRCLQTGAFWDNVLLDLERSAEAE